MEMLMKRLLASQRYRFLLKAVVRLSSPVPSETRTDRSSRITRFTRRFTHHMSIYPDPTSSLLRKKGAAMNDPKIRTKT